MRISVFGLGYVGSVSAACMARNGHTIIGVDPDETKVTLINAGSSPIIEPGLREMLSEYARSGKIKATTDVPHAVRNTDVSFVSVGTPSRKDGSLNLDYVRQACREIGAALADKSAFHIVVARSTMLPGTVRKLVIPELEKASGKKAGVDFGVAVNPEFLREGTAIHDFDHPPKTVIGATDADTMMVVRSIYEQLPAPMVETSIEVAEAVKYTDNAWHAVKVTFANEIGAICDAVGVDGQAVMDVFCQDRKLNISTAYMRPGLAFGGSCLPKDLRALTYLANAQKLNVPMLANVLDANEAQMDRALARIEAQGQKKIGVLGLSFKAGTDDLRESPILKMVETLNERGYQIRIYDPYVSVAAVQGSNQTYIVKGIPHIHKMLTGDFDEFLAHAGTIVIGNQSPLFRRLLKRHGRTRDLIDLVHLMRNTGKNVLAKRMLQSAASV